MDQAFWNRIHGGSTHFPIALLFVAFFFDVLGCVWPGDGRRGEFRAAGFYLLLLAALSSFGAVLSGLVISKWKIAGAGLMAKHHLFVWPAFALMIALALWRVMVGNEMSRRGFAIYLSTMGVAVALIAIAGYWGGEMLIGG
ncbi:MAG TPA: DUF2231 domain-containing protein [Chthoniobacteraceae bacterium]|nr:DUF2231 domain-containing protein [Chthoniobacteraceae bacterium]